jgi:YidC/Oxa1 family membrane protein insertase
MEVWTSFVDLIYITLVTLSTMFSGNMGMAIGVLSFIVRLAFLPLALRMAHHSLRVQAALKKLEPEIQKIREKHRKDPAQIWQKTAELHQEHGIRVVDGRSFLGMAVQIPLVIGLMAAVRRGLSGSRFLWVEDLMQADPPMACICAVLTAASASLTPNIPESQRALTIVVPAALTLLFLWRVSAGVAIYSLSYNLVGVVQSLLIRRHYLTQQR